MDELKEITEKVEKGENLEVPEYGQECLSLLRDFLSIKIYHSLYATDLRRKHRDGSFGGSVSPSTPGTACSNAVPTPLARMAKPNQELHNSNLHDFQDTEKVSGEYSNPKNRHHEHSQ